MSDELGLDEVLAAARAAGRTSERAVVAKALYAFADAALGYDFWKPLDVSMSDAREIAQDAIRVAIYEVVLGERDE